VIPCFRASVSCFYSEVVKVGLLAVSIAMSGVAACTPPPEDYAAKVAAARAAKDENFRTATDSPVPGDKRSTLIPLNYFPVDQDFAIPATLEPIEQRQRMQVPTSTGKIRDLESVGTLKFSWKGRPHRLTAFLEEGERRLFVPFTDLTTGSETYAAGRYLNLDPTATGIYVVDFNAAYHPYCYYSDEFDCPFPPPENRLAIAVQAGERLPQVAAGPR
jgi:uncharacterized protein (DUF1684 family)